MPIRKNASMEKYIKDFEKSDAPQFKGKSKEKRVQMAVAAKLNAMGKKKMEEGINKYEPLFNDLYTKYEKFLNKYRIYSGNDLMHTFKDPKSGVYGLLKSNFDILPAHKEQLDNFMQSLEETNALAEKKGTLCGRCGHVHVKGTPCPRPFIKEDQYIDGLGTIKGDTIHMGKLDPATNIIKSAYSKILDLHRALTNTIAKTYPEVAKDQKIVKYFNGINTELKILKEYLDTQSKIYEKEEVKMTDMYDDAPELKGDQKKLPDSLQKAIIDKVVGKIKEAATMSPEDKAATDLEIKAQQAKIKAAQHKIQNLQRGDALTEGIERDYEGKMAKAQLISIVKNAKDLFDSMDDNTQLKSWIQSKLTKAEDYISSVRTYLDGESLSTTTPLVHDGQPVRDDEGAALNIGDVVKAADGKIYQVVFSYSEGKPFLTPFDLKRRKPTNLRERHYFDNVSEEMNKALKMSKVMEASATKGGFMR